MYQKKISVLFICLITVASPGYASATTPPWLGGNYGTVVSEQWMNVYLGDRKIGFSFSKTEKGDRGFKITSRAMIRMDMMGVSQDLSFSRSFYLDNEKRPIGFISLMKMGKQRQQTVGTITGDTLELVITGVGGSSKQSVKLAPGVGFADTLGFTVGRKLTKDFRLTMPVYLTEMRTTSSMALKVIGVKKMDVDGVTEEVFITDISLQGFTTRAYITRTGETIREEQALLGIISERVTEKEALSFSSSGAAPIASLITFSMIKPEGVLNDPPSIKKLKITIGGLKRAEVIPQDHRQTIGKPYWKKRDNGHRKLFVPITMTKKIPAGGVSIRSVSKMKQDHMKATPEIQSDNKLILREAKRIVGAEKDAWKAAVKINRWVYSNLEKTLADSFSALDVYYSRKGECQSHTNLFSAFARSVGIPTRVVSGIVYSKRNEGFFYHAWPEVYVGQWVAMDPTLGQNVADVSHIKFSSGGVESQLKLVRFIGKISISIDSIKK